MSRTSSLSVARCGSLGMKRYTIGGQPLQIATVCGIPSRLNRSSVRRFLAVLWRWRYSVAPSSFVGWEDGPAGGIAADRRGKPTLGRGPHDYLPAAGNYCEAGAD